MLLLSLWLASPCGGQTQAGAQEQLPVVLYGIAPDPREPVKIDEPPWRGVGKLVATAGRLQTTCTAALIGPATALTAGHCLYNRETKTYFATGSVHFLLGYQNNTYVGRSAVASFKIAPGFDPEDNARTRGSDWAVLTLAQRLGTPDRILTMRDHPLEVGTAVVVGGYSQDYQNILTAASHCHILSRTTDGTGRSLLVHDCTAKRGTSGAPVLVRDGTRWSIGGVEIASGRQDTRGIAAIPSDPGSER